MSTIAAAALKSDRYTMIRNKALATVTTVVNGNAWPISARRGSLLLSRAAIVVMGSKKISEAAPGVEKNVARQQAKVFQPRCFSVAGSSVVMARTKPLRITRRESVNKTRSSADARTHIGSRKVISDTTEGTLVLGCSLRYGRSFHPTSESSFLVSPHSALCSRIRIFR